MGRRGAGAGRASGQRAQIDDAPPAGCFHQGQHRLAAEKDPFQVDADGPVPVVLVQTLERRIGRIAAGAGDQDIEAAHETGGVGDQLFHLGALGDVGGQRRGLSSGGGEFIDEDGHAFGLQVGKDDGGPFGHEIPRRGLGDTAATAGDQGAASGQAAAGR